MSDFKRAVKVAVVVRGMKLQELADKMGIPPNRLSSRLTTNNPSLTIINETAEALDMKASALLALGEE